MQYANAPSQFVLAWGANAGVGYIRTVPVASQISITAGAASFNDGFPPLNFSPIASGGVPPFGQDFNGALNVITSWLQYLQAGYVPQYNSTFSGTIGGYPKGALLGSLSGAGLWQSTADGNTNNPDSTPTNWIMATGGLIGSVRNLTGTCGGGNKLATWTADQLCVGTGLGGLGWLLHNQTFSFNGGGTGVNGMDTGVFPVSATPLYIYAIFNPTTGASGVLATISGSGATVYAGANLPAGYIASCLIGSVVTGAGSFNEFSQSDRSVSIVPTTLILNGAATSYTSVSLTGLVPLNTKSVLCWGNTNSSSIVGYLAADANGLGSSEIGGTGVTGLIGCWLPIILLTQAAVYYKVGGGSSIDVALSVYTF